MLPFTANEQVLYSAIPEMHSRHQCSDIYAALDRQKNRSVIKAVICRSWLEALMITVVFPDKTFSTITFSLPLFFFLLRLLPLWELKVRFTYLSICYYADHGNIFTRMPLDNSVKQLGRLCTMPKKFAIQNNSYLSSGNCCRQIRLTLNTYFCAFGDILWACLYNLVFTCKH